ncbi:hypothetical protein [Streptomyces sp. NPDC056549]|uniref:hypothetical protein n=1 Tax=Streptomyces sp. NPDC056549 TaxID=3345864 RepID=UPI0036B0E519
MDRRLIQTALFGSPDSDEPALCPETPQELEDFRREHTGVTIWCGTQFEGGCGRQLTTRLCIDKICHFAHYGSGGTGVDGQRISQVKRQTIPHQLDASGRRREVHRVDAWPP